VRRLGDVPVVAGVGISTPDQARLAAHDADGVIVGSALVKRVLDAPDAAAARVSLSAAVSELSVAVADLPK
jgi:tryptophan synthase alpha subunit